MELSLKMDIKSTLTSHEWLVWQLDIFVPTKSCQFLTLGICHLDSYSVIIFYFVAFQTVFLCTQYGFYSKIVNPVYYFEKYFKKCENWVVTDTLTISSQIFAFVWQ